MATVYGRNGEKKERVRPKKGASYFWFAGDKLLLVVTVLGRKLYGGVKIGYRHYLGQISRNFKSGIVIWDRLEWQHAQLKKYRAPVKEKDLKEDEELCPMCNGMYFEIERDLEILACVWCGGDGKRKKRPPTPMPTCRSPLHPQVPPQK